MRGGQGTETSSPWLCWGKGALHFPALGLRERTRAWGVQLRPPPTAGALSVGPVPGHAGNPALAEPPSDKAASEALAALGAGEEFT